MTYSAKGLVLREIPFKENDKHIVILAEGMGKLTLNCRGAKKQTSRFMAGTQVFTFAEFEFYHGRTKNNKLFNSLNHVNILNSFYGLRLDLDVIYYASRLCQLAETIDEGLAFDSILHLLLRAFSVLQLQEEYPLMHLYAYLVTLIKFLCYSGYAPSTTYCVECGKPETGNIVAFEKSGILCTPCFEEHRKVNRFLYKSPEQCVSLLSLMKTTSFKRLLTAPPQNLQAIAPHLRRVCELLIQVQFGIKK